VDKWAPTFAMRRFIIAPGGHTPLHGHDWEHEVLMLKGRGTLVYGEGREEHPLKKGNVAYVPPNELHQFRNAGRGDFEFLCLIPLREGQY